LNKTVVALLSLCLIWPQAHAGRPLGTDDASTAAASTCQLEAWYQGNGSKLATVLAPACGVAEGLELSLGLTLPAERQDVLLASGLAVKWVPKTWAGSTPLGELALGLKAGTDLEHPTGSGWRQVDTTALLLASLQLNDRWALHLDLGRGRWRLSSGQARFQASLLNLVATWAPAEQAMLFAEWQGNNCPRALGPALSTVGGRWWLQKDQLGLDLTLGRSAGAGAPTQFSVGFGWYGLGY
jgi:hypothetical protein